MDTDNFIAQVKTEMILTNILQKMLKQDLTLQILNQTDHCPQENTSYWINER